MVNVTNFLISLSKQIKVSKFWNLNFAVPEMAKRLEKKKVNLNQLI